MFRFPKTLAVTVLGVLPFATLADTTALKAALPALPEGYESEIEEETDDHVVEWVWLSNDEETYYIVELNFEDNAVAGFKKTFKAMTFAMDTVDAGGQTFTFDGDMYMTLINKSVLVRVFGTDPDAVKLGAIQSMDFAPLVGLADGG
ncbi:MAG: hypothetical protein AAFN76_12010 [Pseudomonadota bacterium]